MKSGDWNAEVLQGSELAGALIQGIVTATSVATAVVSASTPILWVILQNLGTANVFFGSSTVAATGANRGPRMTQNGESPRMPLDDLSRLFVIVASGSHDVAYIAGRKRTIP